MILPESITKAIDPSGSLITWDLAGTILVVAAITMAFVQVLKELLPLRWGFQAYWIQRWMTYRAGQFQKRKETLEYSANGTQPRESRDARSAFQRFVNAMKTLFSAALYILRLKFIWETDDFANEAWRKLIELAAFGRRRSLFTLPPEQLVAQFSAANQIILEYPNRYASLLKVFAEGADIEDIDTFLKRSPDSSSKIKSRKSEVELPRQDYLDARNRIAHRIQRNLDGIHIALAGDWKLLMQCLVFLTSFFMAFVSVYTAASNAGAQQPWLVVVFVGLLAGYAATVMSDTISVIHGLRRP